MSLPEPLCASLEASGYKPKNVFNFGFREPDGLDEWMRENKINGRWIDMGWEFGEQKFYEDGSRALLYVPDDNQYILTKMRWS